MKKILIVTVIILNSFFCYSQDQYALKKINIIFSINHEISYNLSNFKIINDNGNVISDVEYYPGLFLINENIYNKIISSSESYYLIFNDLAKLKSTQNNTYEILLTPSILNKGNYEYFFCIIEIFEKKYKKAKNRFIDTNKREKYIYDLIFEGYSILNNTTKRG